MPEYDVFEINEEIPIPEEREGATNPPMEKMPDMKAEDLVVEEMSASDFVVEEPKETLPGSDITVEEEPEQAAKDTNWLDDKDHSKFLPYFEEKINKIPKHSGMTIGGNERALSYVKDLQNELTKAMRSDLEGKIDEDKADKLYKKLDDMSERLENQINKLRTSTSHKMFASPQFRLITEGKCENCGDVPTWCDTENDKVVCLKCNSEVGKGLEKVANTPVINVFITPFERACVASIVNGAVSNGKNIEELYEKLNKRYKFTDREKLSLGQLLMDMGYSSIVLDRVKMDENDGENDGELARNYQA